MRYAFRKGCAYMPNESSLTAGSLAPAEHNADVYRSIARKVKEGSCVLFLGPAAVQAQHTNGEWRPIADLCAEYLANRYKIPVEQNEHFSLAYICSLIRIRNLATDNILQDDVANFYKKNADTFTFHPLLAQLTDLRFRMIINCTPDMFIGRFFDEIARAYQPEVYNYYKPSSNFTFEFEKNPKVLIYNLFGSYEHPESLVLTYKHQLAYIKKIVGEQLNERIPDALTNAFKFYRHHLFLGFDFEDWSLRLLLDTLYKNIRDNIQPYAYPDKNERNTGVDTKVFYQGEFSMQFPSVDMETFVQTLLEQYNSLDTQEAGPAGQEKPRAQALVLYSDAADATEANQLIKALRTLNLQIVTLADSVGQGDLPDWLNKMLDTSQIVLPLLSPDFFDPAQNPALPLLDQIVARNNPRKQFLVMPILLKPVLIDGPIANLDSIRPLDRQAVTGGGQEQKYLNEIADGLKRYIDKLPRT